MNIQWLEDMTKLNGWNNLIIELKIKNGSIKIKNGNIRTKNGNIREKTEDIRNNGKENTIKLGKIDKLLLNKYNHISLKHSQHLKGEILSQ